MNNDQDSRCLSAIGEAGRSSPLSKLESLGVRYPVMQAGMTSISGPALAGAVCAAGGIGTLGLHDVSVWEQTIEQTRAKAAGQPICVNLLLPYTRMKHVEVVIRQQVPMVTLFWGDGKPLIQQLRREGVFVFQQVGSRQEAERALDAGVDGLVVQGVEAGGHVRATQRLDAVLPEIVALTSTIPLFAAGGIYTAEDAERAIRLGAHGVCSGTRFVLTPESNAHEAYRQRLLAAQDTLVTELFGLGWPDVHRVVPNKATDRWCRADGSIPAWLRWFNSSLSFTRRLLPMKAHAAVFQRPGLPVFSPVPLVDQLPAALLEATALYAGEQVGRIRSILPAAEIVEELAQGVTLGGVAARAHAGS
ncbi:MULTISPECIES: nitronate monooxygenase family protein [Pseudomonas]|uniref:Nitronate monooxygenase n=1 Tax=Pseudomonas citronellolis TaxID=53408 RepID=A0AAW6PCB0_9PSED|nr:MULTISPECIES: nitronate monooxygenase [Pseudomonas]MBH3432269.1 nitronate monooxygenase [Pseudomonas citronellolis]MDF3845188.1 nitronate monooxygenase [Pseudomonas citronellolis]NQC09087.1 nitronate monooxygenase [Pseudomonas aeruginosa]HBN9857413.1 nitronate monooxygenase [Pseudomonas aeruginosa]HBN9882876.1 nitronate monooxygenase [Pseudomonas aeruginosa]